MKKHEVITLFHVSKFYTLQHNEPLLVRKLFLHQRKERFYALHDISFSLKKGEVLGIIGENGAGKSTILKIITGITRPSAGVVRSFGKVASLIELGAGFHPDLTGRENINLNGILLGLSKAEVGKRVDKIIDFSGLGEFIDEPLRSYSSGMIVRLGFSVAIYAEPDILLIDEVLAVGDESFQKKCLDAIDNLLTQEITLVIVSHNLHFISLLCHRVLYLEKGKIIFTGRPQRVVDRYLADKVYFPQVNTGAVDSDKQFDRVTIQSMELLDQVGKRRKVFSALDTLVVRIHFDVRESHFIHAVFGVYIEDENGQMVFANRSSWKKTGTRKLKRGTGTIDVYINKLRLKAGRYKVGALIWQYGKLKQETSAKNPQTFLVKKNVEFGGGLFYLDHRWVYKN